MKDMKMTHRERVRKALNHEETDRVPIDLGGCQDTIMTRTVYKNLKKYLEQQEVDCDIALFWEGTVFPDEELMKTLNCSVRGVYLPYLKYEIR